MLCFTMITGTSDIGKRLSGGRQRRRRIGSGNNLYPSDEFSFQQQWRGSGVGPSSSFVGKYNR